MSIALPSLRHGLGFSAADVQWVLNAYALVFGGLLLLCGRLADLFGRRRAFSLGLLVFMVGSLLAGLATGQAILLSGRVVQGAGAAAFVPASLSLLTDMFPAEHRRGPAIGAYGAAAGLGYVAGVVGGGVLTQLGGWRWVFLINIPVVLAMLLPTRRLLEESVDRSAPRHVDVLGAALVTSGLMAVIFAITEAPEEDGRPVTAGVAGTVGILLLVAFAVVELRHPAPLVPLRALAARAVLVPNAAIALQSMVGIAWLYLLTLYFQEVLGHRPLVGGLLFAPMTLNSVVSAPVAGRVAGNLGVRRTALTGFAVTAMGLVGMVIGLTPMGTLWLLILAAVIGEAGFMFSNVALTLAATSSMAEDRSGLAAGVLNTFIQVGGGVGLALVAAVLASTLPGEPIEADAYAASLRWGLVACLGFCLAGLVSVLRGLPASVPARRID